MWIAALLAVAMFLPTAPAAADDLVATACSSDQQNLFTHLVNSSSKMTECAVAGPYALIGFQNAYGGVTALLTRDSAGHWYFVEHSGGQITPTDMTNNLPAMPADTALSLYVLAASQDNSQVIPNTTSPAGTYNARFSADPNVRLHESDLMIGNRVQSFNGLFVDRLIGQASLPAARACLRSIGRSEVSIKTYDSGVVQILGGARPCLNSLSLRRIVASWSVTGEVSISAERILGAILAHERFNADPRYARNDRDLSHYDVVFWDKGGNIHITFRPAVKLTRLFAGCAPVGAALAGFIINPATFALTLASSPC
jgi:hypothetical protein